MRTGDGNPREKQEVRDPSLSSLEKVTLVPAVDDVARLGHPWPR